MGDAIRRQSFSIPSTGSSGPVPGAETVVANSAITQGQGIRTVANGKVERALSEQDSLPFDGVALSTVAVGGLTTILSSGILPPAIKNVGAGVACAIGLNATADLVRATDPTCTSAPNWIGDCDTDGTITVNIRRARSFFPEDFGAKPDDPANDSAIAVRSAIAHMSVFVGGRLEFGAGVYYFLSGDATSPGICIVLDRTIQVYGANGFTPYDHGTRIIVPAGKSCFRSTYGNPLFSRIGISTAGKNNNTSAVTAYVPGGVAPFTITVSGGHDFIVGQVVRLPGSGRLTQLVSLSGSVAAGSPTVTLLSPIFGTACVRIGDYITLGAAFPTPTKITNVVGLTLTMASPSAAIAAAGTLVYFAPAQYFRVTGVAGNVLTVDNFNNLGQFAAGSALEHADVAFDCSTAIAVECCGVGDYAAATSFKGVALLMLADHSFSPPSNCNITSVDKLWVYGAGGIVYAYGSDANASGISGASGVQCTDWNFQDFSGLGNGYEFCHADGGRGYLTGDSPGRCTFTSCYTEGGTCAFYGNGTFVLGGTMPFGPGGAEVQDEIFSYFAIGNPAATGNYHTHATQADPRSNFLRWTSDPTGNTGVIWEYTQPSNAGTADANWIKFRYPLGPWTVLAISDFGSAAVVPGTLILPQGFAIGAADNRFDNGNNVRAILPGFQSPQVANPLGITTHLQGDRVWNTRGSEPGAEYGWICTVAGTPGSWAEVMAFRENLLTKSLAASSGGTLTLTALEASHRRIRFTGVLTGNVIVIVKTAPVYNGFYGPDSWDKIFDNQTTGVFTVTVKALVADAGVIVPQGLAKFLMNDSTNITQVGL